MKKIYIILFVIIACWFSINPLVAQKPIYEGAVEVIPVRLEQRGEVLHVEMDVVMKHLKVRSVKGIDLKPLLSSPMQTDTLPKISIKGKNDYLAYERMMALKTLDEQEAFKKPWVLEKTFKPRTDTIKFRYVMPFEEWMEEAWLDVQHDKCGCGLRELMEVERVFDSVTLEKILLPYTITPHMAYVQPAAEGVKSREIQMQAFLDFEVNRTEIRTEYMNNPHELAKIRKAIDDLKDEPGVIIDRMDIVGYASPEGTLAGNRRLSEGRATALRDYIQGRYDFPSSIYHVIFGGENWDGLIKALDSLNAPYSQPMINIIKSYSVDDGRKTKLMRYDNRRPYNYLLKNVFPKLRVALLKIDYHIKDFSIEEAREIIKTRPQNLSLIEMFHVANSYPNGSIDFIDVFETAVRMFPESEVANLNAAASALVFNNQLLADRYLGRVRSSKDLPEYNNTLGVLALLKENYDEAERYLKMAADAGLEEAKLNLEELEKKRTNMAEIEKKNLRMVTPE